MPRSPAECVRIVGGGVGERLKPAVLKNKNRHFAIRLRIQLIPLPAVKRLMNAYLELNVWPDVIPALRSLKNSGLQLAFLSNFTPRMLDANIRHSGLDGIFAHALSTDQVKTYKSDPLAYQLAIDAFKVMDATFLERRTSHTLSLDSAG